MPRSRDSIFDGPAAILFPPASPKAELWSSMIKSLVAFEEHLIPDLKDVACSELGNSSASSFQTLLLQVMGYTDGAMDSVFIGHRERQTSNSPPAAFAGE